MESKRKTCFRWAIIVGSIVAFVVFVCSVCFLVSDVAQTYSENKVYDDLIIIANSTENPKDIENINTPTISDEVPNPSTTPSIHSPLNTPRKDIISELNEIEVSTTPEPSATPEPDYYKLKDYSSMKKNFDALLKINKDCIGWIQIEGTKINYPVVYSSDSQKYLNTGFDGKPNRNGTIYATARDGASGQNVTLYGHAMTAGEAMFGQLKKYKNQSFFEKHKDILFSTPNDNSVYRIFAAFKVKIIGHTFNYTQMNFLNETDFRNFIDQAIDLSVINTGESVPDGSYILTLSTCDGSDSRFVVMGYRL